MSGKAKEIAGSSRPLETREPRIPWLGQLRGGIAARLLLFVLLFSSVVTVILTAVQLYLDYRYDVGTIEQRLGEIEKGYRNSLAEGLWQLDRKQLELQVEGIASLPDVSYAEVSEANGAIAPLTVAAGHKSDGHALRREIPVVYRGSGGGPQIIGRFVVEASLEGVYRRLLQNGIVILISQGAKTFLVSIFIVFIFYRLVGRHLSQIAREVGAYDLWHPSPPMRLKRPGHADPDELDRVVTAFNDLSANLQRSYGELQRANSDLQRDVAARIAAEEALRKSEERFQDYAMAASDWFWETGLDHRFTYVSPRLGQYGFESASLVGRFRWDVAVDDELAAEKWRLHQEALDRHEPFRGLTYRMRRNDGRVVYVESSGQPVFDLAGTFKGYRGVGRDVTEQVHAERALHEARDLAEAASRAKSMFLANMSHELRTPLNAIIGLSEMISDQVLGPGSVKYQEYAGDISASGKHLLGIINEMLDIAKIEAGKYALDESEVDLIELAGQTVRILGIEAERAGLTLATEADPALPHVRADAGAIRRIFFNLLSNAIKFTPTGGRVTVSLHKAESAIEIAISDTGIGIAEKDLSKLMQPFAQVEGAYQRRYRGTGLGLAIVRALVELHGGTLIIESEPERGTRVRLTLPAERILS